MATPTLFQPIQIGKLHLSHRIVLAPLTRCKADLDHTPLPVVEEYYAQRASAPGTLLITEATFIAAKAGGTNNIPGIWSDKQIEAWKKVTDAVHSKGSYIYLQLWAVGRAADPKVLTSEDPSFPYVSASDVPLPGQESPRPLTIEEIKEYVQLYAKAAGNAVHKAGFDGVEIHGANGYLIDQFLEDRTNKRTDEYGGSPENKARFGLEIIDAVVKEIGAERTGIRLSPWGLFLDVRTEDEDPIPTFSYFVSRIRDLHPNLSFIHLVESRVKGNIDRDPASIGAHESNDFIRDIWRPRPLISAGGYTRELAVNVAETKGDLIAFGRHFLSNPDLPTRLKIDAPLNKYDRSSFYIPGDGSGRGYTDYPFAT